MSTPFRPRPGRRSAADPAKIKAAREARDLTQAELAVLVSRTAGLISRIESGDSGVSPDTLSAIAKVLRVDRADLLLVSGG